MEQKHLQQNNSPAFLTFLKDLFINGIDGVVILYFILTVLTSAGITIGTLLRISLAALFLVALIMAISAYIAGRSEKLHFLSLKNKDLLDKEDQKERRLLANLGIGIQVQALAQEEIDKDRKHWKNLMTKLDEGQNISENINPFKNFCTVGIAYLFGGFIPLIPFIIFTDTEYDLHLSSVISLTSLFVLGYFKSLYLKTPLIGGAMSSLLFGAFAGIGGYFIGRLFIQVS